jgi:hypothetical protein
MRLKTFLSWAFCGLAAIPVAYGDAVLLATSSLPGTSSDLSGLTSPLENGAPGNLLGGFGSGIAYAGGNTFLAVPDRGPNAVSFNPLVDDTVAYIDRFQTFKLTLTPSSSGSRPFTLTPTLTNTTLLSSATPLTYGTGALGTGTSGGNQYRLGSGVPALNSANNTYYFTGRSDGFSPSQSSLNTSNARLDPESIRISNDGRSVFISDEYGPYIYQFDRTTGQRTQSYTLPSYYGVTNLSSQGNTEISGNTQGRLANKGMEGLAITPDGKTLVGVMQSPLIQDGGANSKNIRIVTVDVASGAVTHEYVYTLQNANNTVSDILAINDHEFLVDERDGQSGLSAAVKQIYKIDVSGATDVKGAATLPASFTAVSKGSTPFINLLNPAFGLNNADFPAKIEGMAFGEDVVVNGALEHTLWVTNDNDFATNETSNFYVFGIPASDLPDYQAQAIVPEPQSVGLLCLGLGVVAYGVRRAKAKKA